MIKSELETLKTSALLHIAVDRIRGKLDISVFKGYLLSLVFLRHFSIMQFHNCAMSPGDSGRESAIFIPSQANFQALFDERKKPGNGARIDIALNEIETANNEKLYEIFNHVKFIRFEGILGGDSLLRDLLELLWDNLSLSSNNEIALALYESADLYEAAISHFSEFEGKRGDEFSTPQSVCSLLSKIVRVSPEETVCDPACGTGSLLISLCSETKARYGLPPQKVFGQDLNPESCSLARMNLFINGQDQHSVLQGDTLESPRFVRGEELIKFDVVVSHPPFQAKWHSSNVAYSFFSERFYRGVPPDGKADFAFISHMLASLKDTGRMAVIVAHGILFRGNVEGKIRQRLIAENLIEAVVSLPAKLFFNTPIPTVLLIFKKNRADNSHILFIDASTGFIKGKNINHLDDDHISRIVSALDGYIEISNFSRVVSPAEIISNEYSLSVSRYITCEFLDTSPSLSIADIRFEQKKIEDDMVKIDQELEFHLKRLGFR